MALMGLDTLLLVCGLLLFVKVGKLFSISNALLSNLTVLAPTSTQAEKDVAMTPRPVDLRKQEWYGVLEQTVGASMLALVTFFLSEGLYCLSNNRVFPGRQTATTLFSLGMGAQALSALYHISRQMWSRGGHQEERMVIMIGLATSALTVGLLGVLAETKVAPSLDFGATTKMMNGNGRSSSWWMITLVLAAFSGGFMGLCYFPALRFARIYNEIVSYSAQRGSMCPSPLSLRMSFHATFLAPIAVFLLYIQPLVGQPMTQFLNSEARWHQMRSQLIVLICLFRFLMSRRVIQGFCDSSYLVVKHMMEDPSEYDAKHIVSYINTQYRLTSYASLQYIAPCLVTLFSALTLPRVTEETFGCCTKTWQLIHTVFGYSRPEPPQSSRTFSPAMEQMLNNMFSEIESFDLSLSPDLAGALLHSIVALTSLIWFICSLIGLVYFKGKNAAQMSAQAQKSEVSPPIEQ